MGGNMQKHNLTTIVSDFDGTILKNGAMEVPAEFLDIVEQILDKGYHFIGASGRQWGSQRNLMGRLADRISYVANNGSVAISKGQVVYKSVLAESFLKQILADMATEKNVHPMPSGVERDYILEEDVWMQEYEVNEVQGIIGIVKDFSAFPEDIVKVSVYWDNKVDRERLKFYQNKYAGVLQVVESGPHWMDFTNPDANKGIALSKLAESEGFSLEQTISFGDNENDMRMLQSTGVSYVMETAREDVKTAAQKECSDVGEVLKSLFL